jgi:hypothetical protein
MENKETDLKIQGTFEIFDPRTGKTIQRKLLTTYYPGNHYKDEKTIVRKCLKQSLANLSTFKPISQEKKE